MRTEGVIWAEDDPDGSVAHIAEHEISIDEAEDVRYDPLSTTAPSNHAGRMLTCGESETGQFLRAARGRAGDDPLIARPGTAFDSNPPRGKRRGEGHDRPARRCGGRLGEAIGLRAARVLDGRDDSTIPRVEGRSRRIRPSRPG